MRSIICRVLSLATLVSVLDSPKLFRLSYVAGPAVVGFYSSGFAGSPVNI